MSASLDSWYINSDNVVQLDKFYDAVGATYLNAATVTVTVKDASGTAVSGITWPVSMVYSSGSDGKYLSTIDKVIEVTSGSSYFVEITAAEGTIDKFFRRRVLAVYAE